MKLSKKIALLAFYLMCQAAVGQDARTLETKIADLLVQMPADNFKHRDRLAEETFSLGKEGLNMICSMVVPPGRGDDTRARFAIESLSKYLGHGRTPGRSLVWEDLCIDYATMGRDRYVQAFFMDQLQWVGSEQTVEALSPFLSDEFLCHPAIGAMRKADPERAGKVFTAEVSSLSGAQLSATVKAIGELKVSAASGLLVGMLYMVDESDLRRNILRALAAIGDAGAYKTMLKAARAAGYSPDPTGATMALLEYAGELYGNGHKELGDRICKQIIKKCRKESQAHFKSTALEIYADNGGIKNATPLLLEAMEDKRKTVRMGVINYVIQKSGTPEPWIIKLSDTESPENQAEIISLLGSLEDKSALTVIKEYLDNPDAGVRSSAVYALAELGGRDMAVDIVSFMKRHSLDTDLDASRNALLTTTGPDDLEHLSDMIPAVPGPVKAVLLGVLAEKGNPDYFPVLMKYALSEETDVRVTSIRGLKNVANERGLELLLDLLAEDHDSSAAAEIQSAILSVIEKSGDREGILDILLPEMEEAEEEDLYIPLLAGIGGERSLAKIQGIYEIGDNRSELALQALIRWPDETALPVLFDICISSGSEAAFSGYIRQVEKSDLPPEQKLLLLRKILPLSMDPEQKAQIIAVCGNIKTFNSFMFVSGFTSDQQLFQKALGAAIQIALPTPGKDDGLYGDHVRKVLTLAREQITGPESPYIRIDIDNYLNSMPQGQGFTPVFNGKDHEGWKGLVENPLVRAGMDPGELESKQKEADLLMQKNWQVAGGILTYHGNGYDNICTVREYGDFEMTVDWKLGKNGDSGIYLRGSPQVQIWDTSMTSAGAGVGSGGLYNNKSHEDEPIQVADNPAGEWNTFRITMVGERVTVHLNGILVADNVVMENFWDRSLPVFARGPIELQAHAGEVSFRDIYIREIKGMELNPTERKEGFVSLFNGRNLDGWTGNKSTNVVEDGTIAIRPVEGVKGNIFTEKQYDDFILRFEFKLTPGANNGLGIRAPLEGDPAYLGMEIQVLDNTAPVYANLKPWQYHGSVYGVIPARRGFLRPVGEWNEEEIVVEGTKVRVTLNGTIIVDGDLAGPIREGTMDGRDHPGLSRETGHIGFLGHGSVLWYRNIRIKKLVD